MTSAQLERLEAARKSANKLIAELKRLKAELEARKTQEDKDGKDV